MLSASRTDRTNGRLGRPTSRISKNVTKAKSATSQKTVQAASQDRKKLCEASRWARTNIRVKVDEDHIAALEKRRDGGADQKINWIRAV